MRGLARHRIEVLLERIKVAILVILEHEQNLGFMISKAVELMMRHGHHLEHFHRAEDFQPIGTHFIVSAESRVLLRPARNSLRLRSDLFMQLVYNSASLLAGKAEVVVADGVDNLPDGVPAPLDRAIGKSLLAFHISTFIQLHYLVLFLAGAPAD